MIAELQGVTLDLFSTGLKGEPAKPQDHNLGFAIFVVAIEDYCSRDEEVHADARDFLFPPTAEWRDQFDWAVSLAEGLNPRWLRYELDRCRCSWDEQRTVPSGRKSRRQRLQMGRNANEPEADVDGEQAAVAVGSDRVTV
jgi:hypothetical protein